MRSDVSEETNFRLVLFSRIDAKSLGVTSELKTTDLGQFQEKNIMLIKQFIKNSIIVALENNLKHFFTTDYNFSTIRYKIRN